MNFKFQFKSKLQTKFYKKKKAALYKGMSIVNIYKRRKRKKEKKTKIKKERLAQGPMINASRMNRNLYAMYALQSSFSIKMHKFQKILLSTHE